MRSPTLAVPLFALLAACGGRNPAPPAPAVGVVLADSAVVPMEVDPSGRAVVSALLNGRGPYRLAVETGSPDVRLTSAAVASLALPGARGGAFRLDSLRLGDALVRGLEVGRSDVLARLGVDGVLGLEVYRDLLLTLDYPGRRLVLSRGSLPEPDGREVLRTVAVGPFVGVELQVGDRREIGVIDTQGGIGFQALPDVASGFRFEDSLQVVGRAVVGGTDPVEVRRGRLAGDILLGAHRFARPRIAVHELPPGIPSRMTIGIRVLQHFEITLDQRGSAVRFRRAAGPDLPEV